MKRLESPNRRQKILISSRNLNPKDWVIESESKDVLMIQSKRNKMQKRPIYKAVIE